MAHDERPDGRRRSLLQLGCVVCRSDGCRGTQGPEVERNASCPEGDGGTQLAGPGPVAQPRSPSLGRREKFSRNMQPGAIDQVCGRTASVLPPDCSDAEEDQGKLVHPIWATEASLQ